MWTVETPVFGTCDPEWTDWRLEIWRWDRHHSSTQGNQRQGASHWDFTGDTPQVIHSIVNFSTGVRTNHVIETVHLNREVAPFHTVQDHSWVKGTPQGEPGSSTAIINWSPGAGSLETRAWRKGYWIMPSDSQQENSVLRVMFVCTGNTCRSPMAEVIFRRLSSEFLQCQESDLRDRGVDVFSAGLAAADHCPASREAVEVMQRRGLDLAGHLSQRIHFEMLEQSDVVLAMTERHRQVLCEARPDLAGRIRLLHRNGNDISDPFGLSLEAYESCAAEIDLQLRSWLEDLISKKRST